MQSYTTERTPYWNNHTAEEEDFSEEAINQEEDAC
jgi:hypothetical protein